MIDNKLINKILKKYKDRSVDNLSTKERVEVLKLMSEGLDKDVVNLFVREPNGSVSARRMTMPVYLKHLKKNQGKMTVGEILEQLVRE